MSISNHEDIIDSRDIIARIEELESIIEDHKISLVDRISSRHDKENVELGLGDKFYSARGAVEELRLLKKDESDEYQEELDELKSLTALAQEADGYGDWKYGETLIRESYFVEYAEQLADDIGAIDKNASWPVNHIDWEAAADELKNDYTEVDFDGVSYLMRS